MDKHLVNNEQEFMSLFADFDLQEAERFLGIEFAYVDGTFQSDYWKGIQVNEDQEVDRNVYRKCSFSMFKDIDLCFPQEYPCLVLLANDKDFDRTGELAFIMLEFIYPKDFVKE